MKKYDIEIVIGWECNNNCIFCSNSKLKEIAKKKGLGKIGLEKIDKQLLLNRNKRINMLFFVGGEPTIIDNFFEVIKLSKKRGYNRISIMTNGRMLSNLQFCKKIFSSGLTDIGVSIHGHKKSIHDFLTRAPGSFKQTINGIKNLNKLGKKFMTNTVITQKNYKSLPELIRFLSKYKPYLILLSFPNPIGIPKKYFKSIIPTYSEVMPYITKCINIAEKLKQKIYTEDIPFCMMAKYKDHMQELFFNKKRKLITHVLKEINYTANSGREKSKSPFCKFCEYNDICEGVWTKYLRIIGLKEFKNQKNKGYHTLKCVV